MSATAPPPQIVVVDDDPMLAELMREHLTDEGYAVTTCTRGDEAFAVIRSVSPALVILDVRMAGLDGLGVLYLLATDPQTARIPVLLCTAVSPAELQVWDEVLARRGLPVLFKPFALGGLTIAVRALLPTNGAHATRRP